jgi:hypothetical protein
MKDPIRSQSIAKLRALFSTLQAPTADMFTGFYRAEFIGPWWLRLTGRPSVALSGLPGWQGKRFLTGATATNVLLKKGQTTHALLMRCVNGVSQVDGKHGLALHYGADAPVPWRWVRDEIRAMDAHRILGMTVINLPVLNRLSFPFLLVREP